MSGADSRARVGGPIQSGVIPYRVSERGIEVLLIRSRTSGSWIVPKGIVERGLTALDSACKEGWEEAGVRGAPAPEPLGSYRHLKWGRMIDVPLYLLRVESTSEEWPERAVRRREWMSLEDAVAAVVNLELREVLGRVPAALAAGGR